MLPVIICEDDPKQREKMRSIVKDYIALKDYDAALVLSASDPIEVLSYLENYLQENSLYILDVDLQHKINGIALAAKIRELDTYGPIIFVTIHAEMSYLTFQYKIAAMDYIIKDVPEGIKLKIEECIELAYRRYLDDNIPKKAEMYQIKVGSQVRNIPLNDILFFESHLKTAGKIILRTRNSRLEQYGTLRDVENIGTQFYRCHNSFVVNLINIQSIEKSTLEIKMQGGSTIFAASRKMTELLKRMKNN